ncbi:hypothetical protein L1887_44411 [Cichorium endivia]|nr:hypothetical protein L1887_44411 [Cichorium endivia]
MEFLDFMTRPRLRVLWTLRPPATSGSKHLEGNFHREGFNPATGSPTATLLRLHPSRRPHRGPGPSALAAIKLKRTLEKKGLRLRKAPATFLLTAQLRAGTQLVALARHSAPRLTFGCKDFLLRRMPPSIPLSFGLATVLPRRSVSRVSWAPDPRRPRANTHRLRHGLPGYLILFAPHAFAPQRR